MKDVPEFWVKTTSQTFVPIHEISAALGPSQCHSLPFIHSLSGRDTTSYPYFTGKKAWLKSSKSVNITALEDFAENHDSLQLTADVINQARDQTRMMILLELTSAPYGLTNF